MLSHPCILGDAQTKGDKIRIGYFALTFSRAQNGAQMKHHPCNLGDPQTKGGQNQNWLPHPYLTGGPKEGRNAMLNLHSQGSPSKGAQNQNWPPQPCLLRGPKKGGNAMSPRIPGDPKTKGDKIRIAYLTRAFRGPKKR